MYPATEGLTQGRQRMLVQQAFAALGPAPQASRKLNDYLHSYFIKELAEDERSAH